MEWLHSYQLVEEGNGYRLLVNISFDTEFSQEFLKQDSDKKRLKEEIRQFVQKRMNHIKVTSVSIVLGTTVLMTWPLEQETMASEFTMSYLFFGSTSAQIQFVDRTGGALQVVSPSYFDLHADGTLKLSDQFSEQFIREMKNRDIAVVPFLSNHWNREVGRAALANRHQLSDQLAAVIMQHNLDGINVDIEGLTEVDRDAFTDLVRLLREKLPAEKEVSVAVAANPNRWTRGWHGMYDYPKLAEYADYLMLMAYDESYEGGSPGPVASLDWVDRSIVEVLRHAPKEKVVLGLPFFGRYWIEGEPHTSGGKGITKSQVEHLIATFNGRVTFDRQAMSPKAEIVIPHAYSLGFRTLAPGTYTIWYENTESIKSKIELVHKYGLKGTGSWALGQENPAIWSEYKNWVKASYQSEFVEELYGNNRYETGVVISKSHWTTGSDVVVLGRGDVPIDALTSSVVAKKFDAPLLLTQSTRLPATVLQEIERLRPQTIYLAGGEAAISREIEQTLRNRGYEVRRIAGRDRYATSVAVAEQVDNSRELFLVTGNASSPDALSIASYAAMKQIPIVLSDRTRLSGTVRDYITSNRIEKVSIIGGSSAISEEVVRELGTLGVADVQRIAGENRFATSLAIVRTYEGEFDLGRLYFASGTSFVDALPGSAVAARHGAPIILTGKSSVPPALQDWLRTNRQEGTRYTFLGGFSVIEEDVRRRIVLD